MAGSFKERWLFEIKEFIEKLSPAVSGPEPFIGFNFKNNYAFRVRTDGNIRETIFPFKKYNENFKHLFNSLTKLEQIYVIKRGWIIK